MMVDFPAVAGLTSRQQEQLLKLLGRVARTTTVPATVHVGDDG
jgi:hypothetical protein